MLFSYSEKLQPPLITKADKGDKQCAVIVWKFIMMHWGRSQFTNKYIQVQNNKYRQINIYKFKDPRFTSVPSALLSHHPSTYPEAIWSPISTILLISHLETSLNRLQPRWPHILQSSGIILSSPNKVTHAPIPDTVEILVPFSETFWGMGCGVHSCFPLLFTGNFFSQIHALHSVPHLPFWSCSLLSGLILTSMDMVTSLLLP